MYGEPIHPGLFGKGLNQDCRKFGKDLERIQNKFENRVLNGVLKIFRKRLGISS